MEKYIGTKIISARPKTKVLIVEQDDDNEIPIKEEGYEVAYEDGYVSWSPKDVFEKAYRKVNGMNFGLAVKAVKKGLKISRKGWNGKGQFVYYVPSSEYNSLTDVAKDSFGSTTKYNEYLAIRTVQGTVSTWVPSINDCLAEDWEIVE